MRVNSLGRPNHKQNPLRTARGPARGFFFQSWGWFFLGDDWVAQMHSEKLLSSTTLHAQSKKNVPDVPARAFRPQSWNIGLSQFQTLAGAAGSWTQRNPHQSLPELFQGTPWCLWTLPSACPLICPLRGPLEPWRENHVRGWATKTQYFCGNGTSGSTNGSY